MQNYNFFAKNEKFSAEILAVRKKVVPLHPLNSHLPPFGKGCASKMMAG